MRLLNALVMWSLIGTSVLRAEWSTSPEINTPVSVAAGSQSSPVAISDGMGGMIVAWVDARTGSGDIYAQRLNYQGVPLWQGNGIPVCTEAAEQFSPRIVPDGIGGAIIAWADRRAGVFDVFAQRIDSTGVALWTGDGVLMSESLGDAILDDLAADGDGSAVAVWTQRETPNVSGGEDVFAQKVNALGTIEWGLGGRSVCKERGKQRNARLAITTMAVAVVVWEDDRLGNGDIFMQRLGQDGALLEADSGKVVCNNGFSQRSPVIVDDGQGGAYIVWQDARSEGGSGAGGGGNVLAGIFIDDIYASRVDYEGRLFGLSNGSPVCDAAGPQYDPRVIVDHDGGAIVAWIDNRPGSPGATVYAQRINRFVERAWVWAGLGVALNEAPAIGYALEMVTDGLGGAIVLWEDGQGFQRDIYGRHITRDGQRGWDSEGQRVAAGLGEREHIRPVADGQGGALLAFTLVSDFVEADIYAQRVDRYGALGDASPHITAVEDVANDQGGRVTVLWEPSYLDQYDRRDVYLYRLFRGIRASQASGSFRIVDEKEYNGFITSSGVPADTYMKTDVDRTAENPIYWELLGEADAEWLEGYALTLPTPADSGPDGNALYYYMVRAVAPYTDYWESNIDSGYSVDNLAPLPPQGLTATVTSQEVSLRWTQNRESDLLEYRVYRSSEPGLDPRTQEALGASTDTMFVDAMPIAGNAFYAVVAADIHGNTSAKSNEVALVVQDVEEGTALPTSFALDQNYPNPFNPTTTISFSLAERTRVRLSVYDVLGRELSTLVDEIRDQGRYIEWFDGGVFTSGVYFYRLKAGEFEAVRRFVLMK